MTRKPLLLFNQKEAVGGIVRVGSPCIIRVEGMQSGDSVSVAAMDNDRNTLETLTFLRGEHTDGRDMERGFAIGELFQATRMKSVGSRVNVFASTK